MENGLHKITTAIKSENFKNIKPFSQKSRLVEYSSKI